jgi:hypothetical protein
MKTFISIVYGLKPDLKRRNYGRNREKRLNTLESILDNKHFEAAFACKIFLVYTAVVQKASNFSNYARLPKICSFQFIKSISKLPGIFTKKWTPNKEITLAALIPNCPQFRDRNSNDHKLYAIGK